MLKTLGTIAIILFMGLPLVILIVGQLGLLSSKRPQDLGLKDGLLKPPVEKSWNVVSSHASRQAHTDYHVIDPIKYSGDGKAALARLAGIVRSMDGARIIETQPTYLYAEFETKWLKFVDDVEFVLDEPAGVIQMRSASRLGRKDFGVNRARLEAVRKKFGN